LLGFTQAAVEAMAENSVFQRNDSDEVIIAAVRRLQA
jgi:hypothetical protein